uniref:Uncharacterized protein n=1 Tax=Anguilla anguilla TaxID=7936 RepID=A0A0E9VBP3_ANGAN
MWQVLICKLPINEQTRRNVMHLTGVGGNGKVRQSIIYYSEGEDLLPPFFRNTEFKM